MCEFSVQLSAATRYLLSGMGVESRWRRDFHQLSRPAMGPSQPLRNDFGYLSRGLVFITHHHLWMRLKK